MATWTVVGLLDEGSGNLYVAGVFEGAQRNMDRNVDADVDGVLLDQFVGYFDAADPEEAAELARQVMREPVSPAPYTGRTLAKPSEDVPVRSNLL